MREEENVMPEADLLFHGGEGLPVKAVCLSSEENFYGT